MSKETLIVYGGWEGHAPKQNADLFKDALEARGHRVTLSDTLNAFNDGAKLKEFDLIIPVWTMGSPSGNQVKNLVEAVRGGTGLAGTHGGMGDAFRGHLDYEWMVGGHFVSHPHVGDYEVSVTAPEDPIMAGVPSRFAFNSEQYYMMMDPAVKVLATTVYHHNNADCIMPVVWKRNWGQGRVFYSALGHAMDEFTQHPYVFDMTINGLLWATRS